MWRRLHWASRPAPDLKRPASPTWTTTTNPEKPKMYLEELELVGLLRLGSDKDLAGTNMAALVEYFLA